MNRASKSFFPTAVFAGYLGFFVLLFHRVVWGGLSFSERDIKRFYYPVWHYGVSCMKQGVIPLWNPYNAFGAPFLANIQTCVFYPPTLLFYLPDFTWGFNFYILLHLAMASFFTYLWMREMGVSRIAAILSGFAFGMSGYAMSAVSITPSLASAAYLPLSLLVFRRALERSGFSWKGVASLVLFLQYLAGDMPVCLGTALVLCVTSVFHIFSCGRPRRVELINVCSVLAQTYLILFALCAFHLSVFLEFLSQSTRTSIGPGETMMWSIPPPDLIGIAVPFFSTDSLFTFEKWQHQSLLSGYYAGVTAILLAAIALFRRTFTAGVYGALAALGLLLAMGNYSWPYAWIMEHVPFLALVRYPARFFFIFSFSAACLTGFGLQTLSEWSASADVARKRRFKIVFFFFAAAIAGWAVCHFFMGPLRHELEMRAAEHFSQFNKTSSEATQFLYVILPATLMNIKRSFLFMVVGLLTVLALLSVSMKGRTWLLIAMSFFVVVDLGMANTALPLEKSSDWAAPFSTIRTVEAGGGLNRVMPSPSVLGRLLLDEPIRSHKEKLVPNETLLHSLYNAESHDSLHLRSVESVQELFKHMPMPFECRLFDRLNIGYIASPAGSLGDAFECVNRTGAANLFRNKRALSRAYLVSRAVVVKNREEILNALLSDKSDPAEKLFIEEEPALSVVGAGSAGTSNKVLSTKYSSQRVEIMAEVSDRPWLFLSDTYYPGWDCEVDGVPTKIYRANYAFRAVQVPPGGHKVVFSYQPHWFKAGSWLTLLTLVSIGAGMVGAARSKTRAKSEIFDNKR